MNSGATVCAYALDLGNGTELRAVYVLRPGYESALAESDSAFTAGAQWLAS